MNSGRQYGVELTFAALVSNSVITSLLVSYLLSLSETDHGIGSKKRRSLAEGSWNMYGNPPETHKKCYMQKEHI
jgi:hypothetical protein